MLVYPNQKIVKIISEPHNGEAGTYGCVDRKAADIVARLFHSHGSTMALYYYLALNQNGYVLALSPKALEASIGISKKQYDRAVANLIDNGFLEQEQGESNSYLFYELPRLYKQPGDETAVETTAPLPQDAAPTPPDFGLDLTRGFTVDIPPRKPHPPRNMTPPTIDEGDEGDLPF